jgi:tetratricopeptide (TPR) repeat protein
MNEADFLEKSAVYIQEGQLEKAQIILRRMLTDNPSHPRALELAGDLALKMGKVEEAVQRYDQASDGYNNTSQPDKAIVCLEKITHEDPRNENIHWRLADLYRTYGFPNRAVKKICELCTWAREHNEDGIFIAGLRKIVEMQPGNLQLRLSFVKILRSLDKAQDADVELDNLKTLAEEKNDEGVLEEVNRLLPQPDGGEELDPKSRIELGNLLYEIGSKDEAVIEFEKAVSDLIESDEIDEAVNVLNRIVEIDPDNEEAIRRRRELLGEAEEEPQPAVSEEEAPKGEVLDEKEALAETVEEIIAEMPAESAEEAVPAEEPEEPSVEEHEAAEEPEPAQPEEAEITPEAAESEEPAEEVVEPAATTDEPSAEELSDEGMKLFEDLSKEIEGFVPVSEMTEEGASVEETAESPDAAHLEGQIADIEFLLKQTEEVIPQAFEVGEEFEQFKNSLVWSDEDAQKKTELAKKVFDAGLHDTALNLTADTKVDKSTWPLSLELNGAALIRLGRYGEAVRTIAPSLIAEEIPEEHKLELRYLLASAYEGLGDFENAMREIERIMTCNRDYKDVRELYALMGGKEPAYEKPLPEREEKPPVVEGIPPSPPEPARQPEDIREEVVETKAEKPTEEPPDKTAGYEEDAYPTIVQEKPSAPEEKSKEKAAEEPEEEEERGENITFL